MLLSLDGTLVVQLVNFVIFLLILNAIFLKPVGGAIAKRRAYINGVARDIEQFEDDIKALRVQADEQRAQARRDADAFVAEARTTAQGDGESIVSDHQVQASALVAEAQATVALELKTAQLEEDAIVATLARTMLERAVGPEIVA